MKKISIYILFISITAVTSKSVTAQVDPHFSQFYAYSQWLNPGLTGAVDGDYRLTAIYRNQWGNITMPFSTAAICAETVTNKNINLGTNFLNQTAGDGGYKYLTAGASVAYSGVKFGTDGQHQLIFGLQLGVLTRRFDPSKFQYGDQWNPVTGYNSSIQTSDPITYSAVTVFDAGAGVSYFDQSQDKKVNFFAGFSAAHLTRPVDPFFTEGNKEKLPVRYSFHGGVRIVMNDNTSITPNFLYMRQGSAEEKMLGLMGNLSVNESVSMLAGVNYRFSDAISPYIGINYNHMLVGLSYDVNNSELGKMEPGTSSFEISVTYTGSRSPKPSRYLACPRL